jgi:hypothetical protein
MVCFGNVRWLGAALSFVRTSKRCNLCDSFSKSRVRCVRLGTPDGSLTEERGLPRARVNSNNPECQDSVGLILESFAPAASGGANFCS